MKHKTRVAIYLFVIFAFWLALVISSHAEAPLLPLEKQPVENIVAHFAEENGLDTKLALAVMRCESNGKQETVGDGNRSFGIFQYQKATWERHSKDFGETLDINSPYDQARLATWAISNGKGNEWTAYRTIRNGGTYSFYSRQLKRHFTVTCRA